MAISDADVRKIARLAKLRLTDEEVKRFTGQFTDILSYIDQLQELDLDAVAETAQVTGLENVDREDEVATVCTKDELLACSGLPIERGQIKVKSVL